MPITRCGLFGNSSNFGDGDGRCIGSEDRVGIGAFIQLFEDLQFQVCIFSGCFHYQFCIQYAGREVVESFDPAQGMRFIFFRSASLGDLSVEILSDGL